MNLEQALEVVNTAVFSHFNRRLSDVETAILTGAWQGQTYEQIAQATDYSIAYIMRDVGVKLWRLLSQALEEPVSKTNFRAALERRWQQQERIAAQESENTSVSSSPLTYIDWGEAPDVHQFYGRTTELSKLQQWILGSPEEDAPLKRSSHQCRLVALLGIGGIGKTALAAKLAQQLTELSDSISDSTAKSHLGNNIQHFKYVIWRSLRDAPPLNTLLTDWVSCLSQQQDVQDDISRLIFYLRSHRCLLILDNVETIFQEGDRAGCYRPGYEAYGELFKRIGETPHQSCLILTSREKPAELAALEDSEVVRCLQLSGTSEAAQALIETRELFGSNQQKQQLATQYGNNPLAIKIITSSIQDVFEGDIEQFLQQDTILFNSLKRLLEQQFERLSYLEQTVMYWLAINREWTPIAELAEDILPPVSRANLLEALESLTWRSLIEKRTGHYTQQSVVMEYVTSRLIEQVATELATQKLSLFDRHALIKTTVKDYIRDSQTRLILEPVAHQLRNAFGHPSELEQQLQSILHHLRQSALFSTYSGGNLINLLRHYSISLKGYNFSGLQIRHAYLQGLDLQQVNLLNATLTKSVFTQTFGIVFSVAFSPDGELLAAGDDNGQVKLWRVSDGQLLQSIQAHESWIKSIAWSPNGQILASSSADQKIQLWNRDGYHLKTLEGHQGWIRSISWNADGQKMTSASADHTVKIWDIETGTCQKTLESGGSIWAVSWSKNQPYIASGGDDQTIQIWNADTGICLKVLQGHYSSIRSLAWNRDGQTLASGSDDPTVKLWNVETGECLRSLQGHTAPIWSIAWHTDGQTLATASHDRTVRIWNSHTGECLKLLQGHQNWVWSVAWNRDQQTLATGSFDQTVRLWNANLGVCLKTLQGYNCLARSLSFSANGHLASGSTDQLVRLWDVETGECTKTLAGHANLPASLTWHPHAQGLASGSHDLTVRLWQPQTGECLRVLQGHTSWIWAVAWNPNGKTLASASWDQTTRIWDTQTGELLNTIRDAGWFFAIAWNPDGTMLASGSTDQTVKLWHPQTGECLQILKGHQNWVWAVAWSPDGRRLASGGGDATIRIWHPQTGECIQSIQGHSTRWICSIAWSPDGRLIASGSHDLSIKFWDVQTGECVKTFVGHTRQVVAVAFHPNGTLLASSSEDETIKLWNLETGNCLKTLRAARPYEGMNITGITGLTEGQKTTLKELGAFEF